MPFLKNIRRFSRVSIDSKTSPHDSDGSVPTTKSSPTLESPYDASTPASSIQPSLLNLNLPPPETTESVPQPQPHEPPTIPDSNRYSMVVSKSEDVVQSLHIYDGSDEGGEQAPSVTATTKSTSAAPSVLPYAPQIPGHQLPRMVHQNMLLVRGEIGDAKQHLLNGTVTVTHYLDNFPPVQWPVVESQFKALVLLSPGWNEVHLDFHSGKIPRGCPPDYRRLTVKTTFIPMTDVPPLHLVLLLGKDSPGTFDAVPERIAREGNGLDVAIQKYRMAAYLWQAFIAEQMHRHGLYRRCFRYEEDWQPGTITVRDRQHGRMQMRSEAKVHVLRVERTVAELREMSRSQQEGTVHPTGGELFGIAADTISHHLKALPGQTQHVSALFLDTHWDKKSNAITAYAADNGTRGGLHLAIFGSQNLQCYPSCIEEVVSAFTDCTRTDTNFVANYRNESPSNWEAASASMGAHLQEIARLFGCLPQQYCHLNRTFLIHDASSVRTGERSRLVTMSDEIKLHRLDALRFNFHPCFRMPFERRHCTEEGMAHVWPIDKERFFVSAVSGIALIELHPHGCGYCQGWIEYWRPGPDTSDGPPRELLLSEGELRKWLPQEHRKKPLRLEIYSIAGERCTVSDSRQSLSKGVIKMEKGRIGFRGNQIGTSVAAGNDPEDMILRSAVDLKTVLLTVKVYYEPAVTGMEFFFENSTSQLFGRRSSGGPDTVGTFGFDTRNGEILLGLFVRANNVINGLQVWTSTGRRSRFFGDEFAGSTHTLTPPTGYSVGGISGICGTFVEGLALIITR